MITSDNIQFETDKLRGMWNPDIRTSAFSNNFLKSVTIHNIRGINGKLQFNWPITVIGGINGCGKSTFLRICGMAFTRKVGSGISTVFSAGETSPLGLPAEISFEYWDTLRDFTASYDEKQKRWIYSANRPQQKMFYADFNSYPVDRSRKNVIKLQDSKPKDLPIEIVKNLSMVLGNTYEGAKLITVYKPNTGGAIKLRQLQRDGCTYSEHHMSAGERKVLDLMLALENLVDRSFIVLEEPENNLHPDAQRGIAWYLMNLCRRKRHQIIISTHSREIFETLPPESRTLIIKTISDLKIIQDATQLESAMELAGAVTINKPLILVEDVIGQSFLKEILRRHSSHLLNGSSIIPVGNTANVRMLVQGFRNNGVSCVGVRDADTGEAPSEGLFSLPGNALPEAALLDQDNIDRAEQYYSGIKIALGRAKIAGLGQKPESKRHKQIFKNLASQLHLDESELITWLMLAWFSDETNDAKAKELANRLRLSF